MDERICQAGLEAFTGLLDEFRRGNIADRRADLEGAARRRWLGELARRWDECFPGFPRCNWIYEHLVPQRTPANYEFKRDNIFEPTVEAEPAAVVFFGACGSLSDAAMDYAVESSARYLICRTCCHDNVGENTVIVKRPTALNRLFRFKNLVHSRISRKKKGLYFSAKYSRHAYPRSKAAKELIDSEEFLEVAQNTVDSDICRAIIDLDRYLRLTEKGYKVWYKGELFFAERAAG